MPRILDSLYAAAETLTEQSIDQQFSDDQDVSLSLGSCSQGCHSDDSEHHSERVAAVKADASTVRQQLGDCLSRAADVLAALERVTAQHTQNGECGISGVLKFKGRVLVESANIDRALRSIQHVDDNDDTVPQLSSACLLARCNGVAHYEWMMRLAAAEPHVTGLFVSVAATGPRSARHSLEVDLCTCRGLRWIKVRSGRVSNIESDLLHSSESKFVSQVAELCYRARHTSLPFGRHPEVSVVFAEAPPRVLWAELESRGARVVAASTPVPPPLPLMEWNTSFVCLDTTTLVALCSFSAFASVEGYSAEETMECLRDFRVLREQVRQQQEDDAVTQHIDVALSQHTHWTTRSAAASTIANELRARVTAFRERADDIHACTVGEATSVADTLLNALPVSTPCAGAWLDELLPEFLDIADVHSSSVVRQVDAERRRRAAGSRGASDQDLPIPNWIVADITLQEFRWMIETLAGPEEIVRAVEVLRNVMVIDTGLFRRLRCATTPLVTPLQEVKAGGRLLARNKVVFGMADAVGAIMLSSNRQVVNTAKERGITLMVALHPSRSLTEQKVKGLARRSGPSKPPPFEYHEGESVVASSSTTRQ